MRGASEVARCANVLARWCGLRDVSALEQAAFATVQLINYAAYEDKLACEDDRLVWQHVPEGIWPIDTYLQLLVSEVMRLSDDESGYGPRGQDFVVHVDVPVEVRQAATELAHL